MIYDVKIHTHRLPFAIVMLKGLISFINPVNKFYYWVVIKSRIFIPDPLYTKLCQYKILFHI